MSLIALNNIQIAFGSQPLLARANFSIEAHERVGLIGRNGAGKSSLLKIIANQIQADDGDISRQQGVKTVYVAQEPQFGHAITVYDAIFSGLETEQILLARADEISHLLTNNQDAAQIESLMAELSILHAEIDRHDAWQWENRIHASLEEFALDGEMKLAQLSGGQRKRLALARALISRPDILLLDEPTNHLDIASIYWLENLLIDTQITTLFITHDRAFLDRVATRIVELDRGQLRSFPGNFATYRIKRDEQLAAEQIAAAKADKLLSQEEAWIRQGVEARRTRSVSRIQRLQVLRRERAERQSLQGNIKLAIASGERSGKLVAELDNVSLAYGEKKIVNQFSLTIMRGDKIALVGANGVGKTTLLQLILGKLNPDFGKARLGTKLEIAYFDQLRAQLNEEDTLSYAISPGSDWIEIGQTRKHVISYLGDFLFSPQRVNSPVKSLSGGERNRLLLARLFAQPANILVLDEPTNDLDIPTLELLEELIVNFDGTVLLVSHDRAFVDQVAASVIVCEGHGKWNEYVGGIHTLPAEVQRHLTASFAFSKNNAKETNRKTRLNHSTATVKTKNIPSAPKTLSSSEQRELKECPQKIEALEKEQASINAALADGTLFIDKPAQAAELAERYATLDEQINQMMARWEFLDSKQKY